MPGGIHVETVRAAIRAVVARAPRNKDCAVLPGDSIPHRVPARVEEAAHHTCDLPCPEASQDRLNVRDDRRWWAASQPVIVAALHDHGLGSWRCGCVEAAEHPGGGVATDPSIDDLHIIPCPPPQGFQVGRKCLLWSNPEACCVAVAERDNAAGLGIRWTSIQDRT